MRQTTHSLAARVEPAARKLRRLAYQRAADFTGVSNHLAWLRERGFSREDSRRIRYIVEVCHEEEPVRAMLVALSLEGSPETDQPTHPFHAALSQWPDYAALVRDEILDREEYVRMVDASFADICTLSDSIQPRVHASAGVIALTSILRRMFIAEEVEQREGSLHLKARKDETRKGTGH